MNDICPDDRQNFDSFQKVMQPRVISSLIKNVPGSEATVAYLKVCDRIASSFLDTNLAVTERIFRIWYSKYFLRAWRKWLQRSDYTLSENFITPNAFACIEVNAHGLIFAVRHLRNKGQPRMFLPYLMASQPCESIFLQMRSMGSANYTKINFSLFELLHLVSRVELMIDITYSRVSVPQGQHAVSNASTSTALITFPRVRKILETEKTTGSLNMPSDEDIVDVMKKALSEAMNDAEKFGMKVEMSDVAKRNCKRGRLYR